MNLMSEAIDDGALLGRYAAEGDEGAFAQVVGRHADWVHSAALRMTGEQSLAEDVVQGVFLALAKKAGRLRDYKSVGPWLLVATRYGAHTALQQERRRRKHEARAMENATRQAAVDRGWDQMRENLEDAVAWLGRKEREAIVLRFYERLSHGEMAGLLGITEEAARKRVARAVERLRERMSVSIGAGAMTAALSVHVVSDPAPAGIAGLSGSGGAKGLAICKGVHAMIFQAKMQMALVVAAVAAVAAVGVGAAVLEAKGSAKEAPVAAAAAVPATWPGAAALSAAMEKVPAVRSEIIEKDAQGRQVRLTENLLDRDRGQSVRTTVGGATSVVLDDGTSRYRYREGGTLMAKGKSAAPKAQTGQRIAALGSMLSTLSSVPTREAARDIGAGDETLVCFRCALAGRDGFVWLDKKGQPQSLELTQAVQGDDSPNPGGTQVMTMTFDPAVRASRWMVPEGMRVVDAAEYVEGLWPAGKMTMKQEILGQTVGIDAVAIHQGVYYVICSTRLTPESRGQLKTVSEGSVVDMHADALVADAAGQLQWQQNRVETLASIRAPGVQVDFLAVIPGRDGKVPCQVGLHVSAHNELEKLLGPGVAATQTASVNLESLVKVEDMAQAAQRDAGAAVFAEEVWSTAQEIDGLVTAQLYEVVANEAGNGFLAAREPAQWKEETFIKHVVARVNDEVVKRK